ncbi:MAG: hypothetical protein F4139_00315 [Gemmatimonadetes bacterium]|nr:hypothetical protein [Gemmatimonadota bacterium]MYH51373.1 hypothetical protein [Gemmatimonadota bacterium]MYK66914.1 hypothetical protein [Gemmatimonadota bacterium]
MKYRCVTSLLVLGALLGHAGQVHAQRPTIVRPPQNSLEERYEDMKKSRLLAATLELIIPTLGHDYAGDQWAGRPMVYMMGAAVGTFAGALALGVPCTKSGPDANWDSGCEMLEFLAKASVLAFFGSRVWAFVSAWRVANRTNAFNRRRLGIEDAGLALSVTPRGQLALGVSFRF